MSCQKQKNEASNEANIEDSDDNKIDQEAHQSVDGVDEESHASNSGRNSVNMN